MKKMNELGLRIGNIRREEFKVTQAEFARRLGISGAYLSMVENGKRGVSLGLVCKVMELSGMSFEEVVNYGVVNCEDKKK